MSDRWPGGIISKTAPVPTGPFQSGTAPGIWTLEQQAYWAKQGLWPIAGNVNTDVFIENLFSTYLYTGSQVQFSYVDYAAGAYSTAPSSAPADFGTGDFCFEFWYYATSFANTGDHSDLAFDNGKWQSGVDSGLAWWNFEVYGDGWSTLQVINAVFTNAWTHIAVTRSGTTLRGFVNGQLQATRTNFSTNLNGTVPFRINARANAGVTAGDPISYTNIRLVKGNAVYTSNFTPSLQALSPITGTSLLTAIAPNPFLDYSSNNYTLTRSGTVVDRVQPGGSQTITNGINLSSKGGMVWIKSRSATTNHFLFDTNRGPLNEINSNTAETQTSLADSLTSFNSNGFSLGVANGVNAGPATYASWTFREQAKFFDVVTYTGNGANRTIAHNLGSTPGMIIVKRTDSTSDWTVYHRSLGETKFILLNTAGAEVTSSSRWNNTAPTSSVFTLGTATTVNASGGTYVAYLFAHDAGGFGLSGNDNVISCGSFTASSSVVVNLGYEPQWVMIKNAQSPAFGEWRIYDNMRGASETVSKRLVANSTQEEITDDPLLTVTATGFKTNVVDAAGETFIYMAIRRGPMQTPTLGTSVFTPITWSGDNANNRFLSTNITTDFFLYQVRNSVYGNVLFDRLRGNDIYFYNTANTNAEGNVADFLSFTKQQTGVTAGFAGYGNINVSGLNNVGWALRRAPGFFDIVCYTGTGSNLNINHNLGVEPEMIIVKCRSSSSANWSVYQKYSWNGFFGGIDLSPALNSDGTSFSTPGFWRQTPTATQFFLPNSSTTTINDSGQTYVSYLFATVAGVSKVGSYVGTGTTQTINCGFTTGARFVLIKRTSSTGSWYVWDSARGIVAGNDPYLLLNSTDPEVTNTDYIDTDSTGFQISSTAPAEINSSGGTFIFLAIA